RMPLRHLIVLMNNARPASPKNRGDPGGTPPLPSLRKENAGPAGIVRKTSLLRTHDDTVRSGTTARRDAGTRPAQRARPIPNASHAFPLHNVKPIGPVARATRTPKGAANLSSQD